MDGSKFVGKRRFKLLLEFIKYIYKAFAVSRKGVHIGLVVFTDTGKLQFGLKDHFSLTGLDSAMGQVNYPGESGNSVGQAVSDTKRLLFDASGREKVKKVLVTIVVGKSDDDVGSAATALKTDKITSVVVGINANNNKQIEILASSSEHYLINIRYKFLGRILQNVIKMILIGMFKKMKYSWKL